MLHSDALKLLIPVTLTGQFAADLAVEGTELDTAAANAELLLAELFPNSAYETLEAWERVYGITTGQDDPLQLRQNRIIQKMRDLGRLDRGYFIAMAAAFGYAIVIEELSPFMPGWSAAGEELGDDGSDWCCRVWYTETSGYYFRAGESSAGEYLSYSYFTVMRDALNELKPADTFIEFIEV